MLMLQFFSNIINSPSDGNRDNQLYHASEQGPQNKDENEDFQDVDASMQGPFVKFKAILVRVFTFCLP